MTDIISNSLNLLFVIFLSLLILSIFLVLLYGPVQQSFSPPISLESNNFTANDTYYVIAYTPTNNDLHLYYFGNMTFEVPSSRFLANTTHIKIYTNGTLNYPNITANSIYYYSYTYQRSFVLNGTDFSGWLVWIALIVIAFVALALLFYMFFSKIFRL